MSEIKPCPFCGPGNSIVECYQDDYGSWKVGCGACGSHSGIRPKSDTDGRTKVIASWNRRPESERLEVAIRWALGETPDNSGKWFGEHPSRPNGHWWWRKQLRELAGFKTYVYDKVTRSVQQQPPVVHVGQDGQTHLGQRADCMVCRHKADLSAERELVKQVMIPPADDDRLDRGNR